MQETWVPSLGQEDSPGEGNDNPLQCSCLENPMDTGAWWTIIHRVAKSQTRLKRLDTQHTSHTWSSFQWERGKRHNIHEWVGNRHCEDKSNGNARNTIMKRQMKNVFDRLNRKYDTAKKINNEHEKRATEMIKTETQRGKKQGEKNNAFKNCETLSNILTYK